LTTSVNSRRPSVHKRHGDATVRKRFFFRDNFIIFRRISKIIAFLELVLFSTCVYYANFQFSWWSRDHFLAHFRSLYLPKLPVHRLFRL